jgi:gas vesicle protein
MGSGSDEVDELRAQIDQTRENLGASVGALAYKADVKNRGQEVIADKKEAVMEKVDELKSKVSGGGNGDGGGIGSTVKDKLPDREAIRAKLPDGEAMKAKIPDSVGDAAGRISDAAPSKEDAKQKAQAAAAIAKDNPLAVVAGATAAGLAAGLALPETDIERQKVGPAAQNARQQVESTVQEKVQQVKSSAQEAAQTAANAVKEKGQEHGGKVGELAETAAAKTQEKIA